MFQEEDVIFLILNCVQYADSRFSIAGTFYPLLTFPLPECTAILCNSIFMAIDQKSWVTCPSDETCNVIGWRQSVMSFETSCNQATMCNTKEERRRKEVIVLHQEEEQEERERS